MQHDNHLSKTSLIIWAILLLSNSVFAYIAVADLLQTSALPKKEGLEAQVPLIMAVIFAVLSFITFRWGTSPEKLKSRLKTTSVELDPRINLTPQMYDSFKKMDSLSKKKFILRNKTFTYMIMSWIFAESVNIFGLTAPFFGATDQHYYYFFFTTVCLMFINHPRHINNINKLK